MRFPEIALHIKPRNGVAVTLIVGHKAPLGICWRIWASQCQRKKKGQEEAEAGEMDGSGVRTLVALTGDLASVPHRITILQMVDSHL